MTTVGKNIAPETAKQGTFTAKTSQICANANICQ